MEITLKKVDSLPPMLGSSGRVSKYKSLIQEFVMDGDGDYMEVVVKDSTAEKRRNVVYALNQYCKRNGITECFAINRSGKAYLVRMGAKI